MKILFVVPLINYNTDTPAVPLGVLAICSFLRIHSDHDTFIFDRTTDRRSISKVIKDIKPDIVGVSVKSNLCLSDAQKISQTAKAKNIPVIWGGEFPSACPEVVLKEDCVDMVGVGEGEKTCLELLDALNCENVELNKIDGLVYKSGDKIIANNERTIMSGDELARVDYDLVDVDQYVAPLHGCKKMIWNYGAKGCTGQCTFCFNKSFHKRQYRKRNYDDILAEIQGLVENHGVDGMFFGDEIWCKSSAEMRNNCDKLRALGLNFTWGCMMKVGVLSAADYDYMYNAGCRWIFFGVESGSPERLKKIKKNIPIDKAIESIKDCYLSGICPISSFIIGFPDETVEELRMTVDLMKEISKNSTLTCYHYSPYIGSELYDDLVASGRLKQFDDINDLKNCFFGMLSSRIVLRRFQESPR